MNDYKAISSSFRLNNKEKQQLAKLILNMESLDFIKQNFSPKLFSEISFFSRKIPSRLAHFLLNFKNLPNKEGAIIIKNLPLDESLPSSPTTGALSTKATNNSEWLLLLVMSNIGEIVAYQEEKHGKYIHDIVPRRELETMQGNSGSVFLELHTEHGFHPHKQDYLGLICLRPDHNKTALNLIAPVKYAISKLDNKTIKVLQKKLYQIHLPQSFVGSYIIKSYSPKLAVLSEDLNNPVMCVDFEAMRATTTEANEALQLFCSALETVMRGSVLHNLEKC